MSIGPATCARCLERVPPNPKGGRRPAVCTGCLTPTERTRRRYLMEYARQKRAERRADLQAAMCDPAFYPELVT